MIPTLPCWGYASCFMPLRDYRGGADIDFPFWTCTVGGIVCAAYSLGIASLPRSIRMKYHALCTLGLAVISTGCADIPTAPAEAASTRRPSLVTSAGKGFLIDNLSLATYASPSSAEQCKCDGWRSFTNPTFKSQGDCIQFVTTGK